MQDTKGLTRQNFTSWIQSESDILFSYIRSRVSDFHTAEDLFQDTLMAAWASRESFRSESKLSTWIIGIARNKIMDHFRNLSRGLATTLKIMADLEEYFDKHGAWKKGKMPGNLSVDDHSASELDEFYKVFNACREKLNNLQDAVFCMKYMDDKKSEEICKELDISTSNYWVLVHRGKLQLRDCIEKNWVAHA